MPFDFKPLDVSKGDIIIVNPQIVSYGLLPGSGDLVGWAPVVITEDMVGKTIAQFTSIEVKTKNDSISPDQKVWNKAVLADGGRSEFWKEENGEIKIIKGDQIK